jgi:hypothetical protein
VFLRQQLIVADLDAVGALQKRVVLEHARRVHDTGLEKAVLVPEFRVPPEQEVFDHEPPNRPCSIGA